MKEQYNQLIITELPNDIIKVFSEIRTLTKNFSNSVIVKAHMKNFNRLFELVKLKFATAIKNTKPEAGEKDKKQKIEAKIKAFNLLAKIAVTPKKKAAIEKKIKAFELLLKLTKIRL